MYIDPNEAIVKQSDLLTVQKVDGSLLAGGMVIHSDDDPDDLVLTALRFLSAAVYLRSLAAEKAAKETKAWELEHAVPLARRMHDTFHSFSDNYLDNTDEDVWLQNYRKGNHLVKKWVATASAALKAQEDVNE